MTVVLDTSAILAVVFEEGGAERVLSEISGSTISSVSLCEAASKMIDKGWDFEGARSILGEFGMRIVSFDAGLALDAAAMRPGTSVKGLSLGDRACLALAERESLPVLTGDRNWAHFDFAIDVELIR